MEKANGATWRDKLVPSNRKNGARSLASRMTQGIFVGHDDRTGAVLCITKNGDVRGKKLDATATERCMGLDELGRLVWHVVANGGS